MDFRKILVFLGVVLCANHSIAQELGAGGSKTSQNYTDQLLTGSTDEEEKCGPLKETSSLLASAQTTAVCSPVALAVGAQGLKKIAPEAAKKLITRVASKVGVRIGLYTVGGAGALLTMYDVANILKSIASNKCDDDLILKRALLEKVNRVGENIIAASEGTLDSEDQKKLIFSSATLNDSYLKRISCSQLANQINKKKKTQQSVWTNTLLSNSELARNPEKKNRLQNKEIEGFHHDNLIKNSESIALSELASQASCLPIQTQIEIACALGTAALVGTPPAKSLIAKWKNQAKKNESQKIVSSRGQNTEEPWPFQNNTDNTAKILAQSKDEVDQFRSKIEALNLTPRQKRSLDKELSKFEGDNAIEFSAQESFKNLKLSSNQKREFHRAIYEPPNKSLLRGGVQNKGVLSTKELALLKSPAVSVEKITGGGINPSYTVTLKNGYKGVFKPCRDTVNKTAGCLNEVLAYKIDKKLGLNLVPETIVKPVKVNGKTVSGSFQKKIADAEEISFSKHLPRERDFVKQQVFDKVIGNIDRHNGNYLITNGRKLISIDHGLAFHSTYKSNIDLTREQFIFLNSPKGQKVTKELKKMLTKKNLAWMSQYINPAEAKDVQDRIRQILRLSRN